ncbi:hypothetical protein LX32DRAFT_111578 [Colletotrichum zoysiae]|uniref:Uncharacterized protein n=1 Tax=Colletotrichum zoysiae TaxID=1216348 RepID=A0AAD9H8A5_9PEZI|nr:hypothetical protein LX32DRAFT_111578 [Colletotrichum zoysiae]
MQSSCDVGPLLEPIWQGEFLSDPWNWATRRRCQPASLGIEADVMDDGQRSQSQGPSLSSVTFALPPLLPPFFPPPSVYGYLSAYCGHRYCDTAWRTQSACRFHRDGDPGQGSRHKGRGINRHKGMGRHQIMSWRSGDEQADSGSYAFTGGKNHNHGPERWQNSLIHSGSGHLDIGDWGISPRLIARKNSNLWFCIFILISNDWGC